MDRAYSFNSEEKLIAFLRAASEVNTVPMDQLNRLNAKVKCQHPPNIHSLPQKGKKMYEKGKI